LGFKVPTSQINEIVNSGSHAIEKFLLTLKGAIDNKIMNGDSLENKYQSDKKPSDAKPKKSSSKIFYKISN